MLAQYIMFSVASWASFLLATVLPTCFLFSYTQSRFVFSIATSRHAS